MRRGLTLAALALLFASALAFGQGDTPQPPLNSGYAPASLPPDNPLPPAVEFVREVGEPTVRPNTVHHIVEMVARHSWAWKSREFILPEPVFIGAFTVDLSYSALGKPCGDAAVVLHVFADDDVLASFDMRINTEHPGYATKSVTLRKPLPLSRLQYEVLDDMCHPTNIRLDLTIYRD